MKLHWILFLACLAVAASGCQRSESEDELSEASARRALIEMLEQDKPQHFESPDFEIAELKSGQRLLVTEPGTKGNRLGYWNCDLNAKKFWFGEKSGLRVFECHGIFAFSDGRWHAEMTGSGVVMEGIEPPTPPADDIPVAVP